jgi:GntR family transcriptional regulator/MocR family aminotransferase
MIALREQRDGSRFAWLYGELRSAILDGRLAPGSRVPSTRQLAAAYDVARGTVVAVFEQLHSEGYVTTTAGSGTRVAESLPDDWFRASVPRIARSGDATPSCSLSVRGERLVRRSWLRGWQTPPRPFRLHQPAFDERTLATWRRISSRAALDDPKTALTGHPFGYRPLREATAEHLGRARGFSCSADRVMILPSTQISLELAARLLADPGEVALVEDPGYTGAAYVFEANDLVVRSLPVDESGANIEAVRPDESARLAYVTPAHQFPLGITMSARRRLALLSWASRNDAWIVEDDYDGEYRFSGRPIAALAGLDAHERVIHVGTFSKVLFPALRIAYMVVPDSLVDAFAAVRVAFDGFPPIQNQLVLHRFLADGHFERHLRRMRSLYAERLATFTELVEQNLGDELEIEPSTTGLQAIGRLRTQVSDDAIARRAYALGVDVVPMSRYGFEWPVPAGLHFGFGGFDADATRDGIARLVEAFRSMPARTRAKVV